MHPPGVLVDPWGYLGRYESSIGASEARGKYVCSIQKLFCIFKHSLAPRGTLELWQGLKY